MVASAKRKCAYGESRPRPDARCRPGWPHSPGASEFSIHCPLAPTALQHPSFCSFLCGSVRSPRPPMAPSIYFLPSSLRPMSSHFCSFLCGSVRSPRPPDAIHLPTYRFSCTLQPPTFALFIADPSAVRLPPPTPFIFLLTYFPFPHNPSPLPNTPSAALRTHPAPYLPTLPYSPLYARR